MSVDEDALIGVHGGLEDPVSVRVQAPSELDPRIVVRHVVVEDHVEGPEPFGGRRRDAGRIALQAEVLLENDRAGRLDEQVGEQAVREHVPREAEVAAREEEVLGKGHLAVEALVARRLDAPPRPGASERRRPAARPDCPARRCA